MWFGKVREDLAHRRFVRLLPVVIMRACRKIEHLLEIFLARDGCGGGSVAAQIGGTLRVRGQREVRVTPGGNEHPFQNLLRGRASQVSGGEIPRKFSGRQK
jgi:hypothetical protein